MASPYDNLPSRRFWRTGVTESHPLTIADLYRKKFALSSTDKLATAGSCFAQHVTTYLRKNGFAVMDLEPQPPNLPAAMARNFGYGIYSARFGNIYTVRQLLQLAQDADTLAVDERDVWEKNGRYFDALRPAVEPNGLDSPEEALLLREHHLRKVKRLFSKMDVFIFTLGLTEAWIDNRSGRVYPTAPGTVAGDYDPGIHEFKNFSYDEIRDDFVAFRTLVRKWNPKVRTILTVSPVPLTATAADDHVLTATTYSKSVLRAVAGELALRHDDIDYFPSYEIIASPWSRGFFYESNMRSVSIAGVENVMRAFFGEHRPSAEKEQAPPDSSARRRRRRRARAARNKKEEVVCEEVLLEAFAR